ncbi:hypothetical protein EON82_21455 [bacterium]|nr:MAG: hypothetical protein EON82_21455 [bacterium]
MVHDFGAEMPLVSIRSDGIEIRRVVARLANGKRIGVLHTPSMDTSGRVWVTDGHGIFRLGGSGVADRALGGGASGMALREIGDLVVTGTGNIYAVDSVDQRVHAFDEAGRKRFVASPRAADFDVRSGVSLQVTRSGDVYLEGGKRGTLHFSPKGVRMPDQALVSRDSGSGSPVRVPPDWRWKWNVLLDGRGRAVTSVRRWPNGDWLTDEPSGFAPDGRFVVVESDFRAKGPRLRFAVYTANGKPLRMALLPAGVRRIGDVAFDGERLFVVRGREVLAVSLAGVPLWKSRLPSDRGRLFVARGGLAWFDGVGAVRWYGLPRR